MDTAASTSTGFVSCCVFIHLGNSIQQHGLPRRGLKGMLNDDERGGPCLASPGMGINKPVGVRSSGADEKTSSGGHVRAERARELGDGRVECGETRETEERGRWAARGRKSIGRGASIDDLDRGASSLEEESEAVSAGAKDEERGASAKMRPLRRESVLDMLETELDREWEWEEEEGWGSRRSGVSPRMFPSLRVLRMRWARCVEGRACVVGGRVVVVAIVDILWSSSVVVSSSKG
ncbi:hypothetical protein C8R46DRAFT_1311647 [Mycena filopes]|nr:hypothetical protein C8R46DRAFT_1311647 [Mycena filopes]